MSSLTQSASTAYQHPWGGHEHRRGYDVSAFRPHTSNMPSAGLLIGGLAVLGLGALLWYEFGPDLVRYMKIREM